MYGVLRRWRGLALAALFLTSGCGLFDPDVIEVSLSLSKSEIAPDSTIRIEIRTANRGSDAIAIGVRGCPREFEILDGGGAVVGPGPLLCSLALLAPLTLEPGQSHTRVPTWTGRAFPKVNIASGAGSTLRLKVGSTRTRRRSGSWVGRTPDARKDAAEDPEADRRVTQP